MKIISLTQGFEAVVDDDDYEDVSYFKWHVAKKGRNLYAARNLSVAEAGSKGKQQHLHQFILGVSYVDHRDGDGLNNQRHNLRPASRSQNAMARQKKFGGASSRFRGVAWSKAQQKWKAQIKVAGRTIFLGRFKDEKDAASAYDVAALKHFGPFASPNFI